MKSVRSALWRLLQRLWRALVRLLHASGEAVGLSLARKNDYYSPLPSLSRLKENRNRWYRPSSLRGVTYDLEAMKRELLALLDRYGSEFSRLPPYAEFQQAGFGPGYTEVDALTLYMMIRHLKPNRYIEVGSGLSTYYCHLAAARNAAEGHPVHITCIEPHPYPRLYAIPGIRVEAREVQDVALPVFQELQASDVLFIDSSHVLRVDGDVPYLYLEVLPALAAGVAIHVHDVPFPFNIPYPPELWLFESTWPKFWNEAMVLQAFLCFNDQFEIRLSTPLIRHFDEPFLEKHIPGYRSVRQNPNTFSSLWLVRRR